MITHIPFQTLGRGEHGWLSARFHFSFAHYYNPKRMGFGKIRVINDDLIKAGYGFDPHPHKNMEIITYVRSGEVSHQDSQGNKGVTKAGEVQVMSAGSGIVHSEYNLGNAPLKLYQIWIESARRNVTPRWETASFPKKEMANGLSLLVSGYEQESLNKPVLAIYQQVRIYAGVLKKGCIIHHKLENDAYLLASKGHFIVSDSGNKSPAQSANVVLKQGDGAEVTQQKTVTIEALSDCELLLIDTPE